FKPKSSWVRHSTHKSILLVRYVHLRSKILPTTAEPVASIERRVAETVVPDRDDDSG
ncbi:hypothetical protein ACLOJK_004511, partial [Asimina triloba]